MNNKIIRTKNLAKNYRDKVALVDVNLNVEKGTIYGLLGSNGAGKTTLLKVVLGLQKFQNGSVEVFSKNISDSSEDILSDIGSIIEIPVFYNHLSAHENIRIHLEYMNKEVLDIDKILVGVGLDVKESIPVSDFSFGMKQRLGIARAVSHKPKLLLLDEPINGLDPFGIKEIRELFLSLKEQGTTILLSSHILSEIELISDTIGILSKGRLINEVNTKNIENNLNGGLENYFFQVLSEEKSL